MYVRSSSRTVRPCPRQSDVATAGQTTISPWGMPEHRQVRDPASGFGVVCRSLGAIRKQCQARGESRAATLRKVLQGRGNLTTKVCEVQSVPALPIVPMNVDGFCCHDDP